jgi:hypothetical protein
MAARTLAQIITELNPTFKPQVQSLQQQQALIPGEIQAQESALNAKKDVAYEDIVNGARRRGMGFSGIPLGEQARYAATDYAPALANLRQQGQQKAMSLQDAILSINERRDTLGHQLYQTEQDRAFQAQQAELARRAAASSGGGFSPSFGNPTTTPPNAVGGGGWGSAAQRSNKGFNFTDHNGQSVSAAVYAKQNNIPFRSLLERMAKLGDAGAKQALGFVGNDFGYNPKAIGNNAQLYNNLVWGSGLQYRAPKAGGGGGGGGF